MCQPSALVGLLLALTRANAKEVLMRQEVHRHVVDSHGELHPGIHRMHPDHLLQKDAFQNMAEAESEKNCNSDKTSFKFTFADEFVNVDDVPPADGQPLSAHNKLTSLQRNVTVESSDISKLSPLTLPGQMRSANLFLFDVMVLPHQNMLAIFSLGPKPAAFVNSGPHAKEELNKLTVGLAFHPGKHNLKCGILDPDAIDSNAVGGSIITLCQAPTVDFAEALEQAQRKKKTLAIQLGQELVHVSPHTLSAGQSGFTIPRTFTSFPPSLSSGRPLKTSLVMPWFGDVPLYLAETMAYLWKVGVSHVYLGLYNQRVPGETKNALQKVAQPGFVSILELDAWKVFKFRRVEKEVFQGLVNDWALYHAKNWDDLLLMHDYDELVVPRKGQTLNMAWSTVLSAHGMNTSAIDDLCYLLLCPFVTYVPHENSLARINRSRAVDFPLMDGGSAEVMAPNKTLPLDRCREGGYRNVYPKSVVVVRNIYKALIHIPAACSAVSYKEQQAGSWRAIGKMLAVKRDDDVVLQHWTGMFELNRFTPYRHRANTSIFTKVWGPLLP